MVRAASAHFVVALSFFLFYNFHSVITHNIHNSGNLLSLHLIFLKFNCKSMCNSQFVFKLTENAVITC